MGIEYFISLYLDKRRILKSEKYPLRVRVFTPHPRKQKLYSTKLAFTENEFRDTWETLKPKKEYKEMARLLRAILDKAEEVAGDLDPFTFEQFEKNFYQRPGDAENVFLRYDEVVTRYKQNNQIGTAKNYELSRKSIEVFLKSWRGKIPEVLLFREITPEWLNRYENYMVEKKRSQTTVGIYLRPLRALFKAAISEGVVKQTQYPFGRGKYEIPQPETVRKALSKEQLKALYETKPENKHQEQAKDFWFFLFNTAGINIKDLVRLKYENLQGDKLIYVREKTKRTTKSKLRPVVVFLNQYAKDFIEKYGNPDRSPKNYIFSILNDGMTEDEKFNKAGAFTRSINQHLKKLAKVNGLPEEISTYWSRHSFATNAIRGGASMEQIRQALNHHNLTTTQNYFAGFDDESMKGLTDNLMDF